MWKRVQELRRLNHRDFLEVLQREPPSLHTWCGEDTMGDAAAEGGGRAKPTAREHTTSLQEFCSDSNSLLNLKP